MSENRSVVKCLYCVLRVHNVSFFFFLALLLFFPHYLRCWLKFARCILKNFGHDPGTEEELVILTSVVGHHRGQLTGAGGKNSSRHSH